MAGVEALQEMKPVDTDGQGSSMVSGVGSYGSSSVITSISPAPCQLAETSPTAETSPPLPTLKLPLSTFSSSLAIFPPKLIHSYIQFTCGFPLTHTSSNLPSYTHHTVILINFHHFSALPYSGTAFQHI